MKKIHFLFFALVFAMVFSSCLNPAGSLYPHTEYAIEQIGFRSGLSSSSSDTAFDSALNDVIQTYIQNNQSGSEEITFDGVTYVLENVQVSTGGVPTDIRNRYYEELGKYDYEVGSCWGFAHVEIPTRGGIGTVYFIYSIIKGPGRGNERYFSLRGNVSPKR